MGSFFSRRNPHWKDPNNHPKGREKRQHYPSSCPGKLANTKQLNCHCYWIAVMSFYQSIKSRIHLVLGNPTIMHVRSCDIWCIFLPQWVGISSTSQSYLSLTSVLYIFSLIHWRAARSKVDLALALQLQCQCWVLQMCGKAHLHHPENKLCWQGGLSCSIRTTAGVPATDREQLSANWHGGMGRVMGGPGGGVPRQRKGGTDQQKTSSIKFYLPSQAWKSNTVLLESVPWTPSIGHLPLHNS